MISERQNRVPIAQSLKKYVDKEVVYFDVPGHKKNTECKYLTDFYGDEIVKIDTNSSKEMDNLSTPKGAIKDACELMAEAYGADYAHLLINGSTVGVQAMIMSVCSPGDKIILPRNVHKSVINALILVGATPIYMKPEIDCELGIISGVKYEEVEKTIESNKDAKGILLLNPTYYGITVNLKAIVELAHRNNMVVLVDEAHGAHFAFHKELPIHGMAAGADASVVSMHKSCGSLTQSSVLTMKKGRISEERMRLVLNLLQTTSASYILMSSLDIARRNMVRNGEKIITELLRLSGNARKRINTISNMKTFSKKMINGDSIYDVDETKLVVHVSETGYTGFEVYDILHDKYNIQVEVADANNIMAVISIGDTEENIDQLVKALEDISESANNKSKELHDIQYIEPEVVVSPREAYFGKKTRVKLDDAENKISTESIMVYPPGIPIISPGERITKRMLEYVKFVRDQKCAITDLADENVEYIYVLEEKRES